MKYILIALTLMACENRGTVHGDAETRKILHGDTTIRLWPGDSYYLNDSVRLKPCPPEKRIIETEWKYRSIYRWENLPVEGIPRHDVVTVVEGDSITFYFRGPKYKYDTMLVNAECGKTIYVNNAYPKKATP